MTLRRIPSLVLVLSVLVCNAASAQEAIVFKVVVTPNNEATTLRVSGTTSDDEITDPFSPKGDLVNIPVDPSAASRQLFVTWTDGTTTGFPIVATFSAQQQPEEVRLSRAPDLSPTKEIVARECVARTPTNRVIAFSMFYTCQSLAHKLELADKWAPNHLRAINGWMIANDYLYRKSNGLSLGIDEDLLRVLSEIFVNFSNKADVNIKPLTLPEVKRLLDQGKNQQLKASAIIAYLAGKKQFQKALTANEAALFDLTRQHNEDVTLGVTKSQLEANDPWIKQIGRGQALLSGHIVEEREAADGFPVYSISIENSGSVSVSLFGNYGCYAYDSKGQRIADKAGMQFPEIVSPLERDLVIAGNTSRTLDFKSLGGLPAAPEDMGKIDLAYQVCQIAYSTSEEPKKSGFFEIRRLY
ncbi:hypothetical protein [Mesorhizobium sp. B1-1-8]|uniref:hypothetical protein n=1 Tax=Mesorhizobium sp. B1-1-8 TaxID=2589976 RepID=UPI001126B803|nr:hypothetical protein [Mesorhizobium sp. B1-1-8]UCI07366.1 hypothetical protein FJ974_26880 [Mesorhizobium sp. B1-1-8]